MANRLLFQNGAAAPFSVPIAGELVTSVDGVSGDLIREWGSVAAATAAAPSAAAQFGTVFGASGAVAWVEGQTAPGYAKPTAGAPVMLLRVAL